MAALRKWVKWALMLLLFGVIISVILIITLPITVPILYGVYRVGIKGPSRTPTQPNVSGTNDPLFQKLVATARREGWIWLRPEDPDLSAGLFIRLHNYDYHTDSWQPFLPTLVGPMDSYDFSYSPSAGLLAFYQAPGLLHKHGVSSFPVNLCIAEVDTGATTVIARDAGGSVSFSPDGQTLAFYDLGNARQGKLRVYDIASRTLTQVALVRRDWGIVTSPVFSPDSEYIYFVELDELAYKLNLGSGEKEKLFPAHSIVSTTEDGVLFALDQQVYLAKKQGDQWVTKRLHPSPQGAGVSPYIYRRCFATPGGEFVVWDEWHPPVIKIGWWIFKVETYDLSQPPMSWVAWRIFEVGTGRSTLIRDYSLFGVVGSASFTSPAPKAGQEEAPLGQPNP